MLSETAGQRKTRSKNKPLTSKTVSVKGAINIIIYVYVYIYYILIARTITKKPATNLQQSDEEVQGTHTHTCVQYTYVCMHMNLLYYIYVCSYISS